MRIQGMMVTKNQTDPMSVNVVWLFNLQFYKNKTEVTMFYHLQHDQSADEDDAGDNELYPGIVEEL